MARIQTADGNWQLLDSTAKHPAATLRRIDIPVSSGVYAWYRGGQPIYVGKASSLRSRLWSQHLGQSRSLRTSAFRRNVAQHLGFATAADIYTGRVSLDPDQLRVVREWIIACSVAWVECETERDAVALEDTLKADWLPRLTKR